MYNFYLLKHKMELTEFKEFSKEMIDYVGNYLENIRDR